MIFLMLSCATPEPIIEPEYLSNPRLLRRMSLDVRGTLPTLAEYELVRQPNVDWDSMVDALLDSPEYEEHLVHRFGDIWHTRVDQFDIVSDDFNLDAYVWWFPFSRTVGEEPLRLMAHIAANDLPWTEIVTSDTVLTNDLLATIFPIEYLDGTSPDEPDAPSPRPTADLAVRATTPQVTASLHPAATPLTCTRDGGTCFSR